MLKRELPSTLPAASGKTANVAGKTSSSTAQQVLHIQMAGNSNHSEAICSLNKVIGQEFLKLTEILARLPRNYRENLMR